MKKTLQTIHRWLGFPLGLFFIVIFGTGFLTAVDELLKHTEHRQYQYSETSMTDDAYALSIITEGKKNIRQVIMPTENTPYYQVVLRGENFTYAIDDLTNPIHSKKSKDGFFGTVLQLHRNFLLGKEGLWGFDGKYYTTWVGLIAMFISLLGFWLWWPSRKKFTPKNIVPRGHKRKYYYFSHMTSGVVTLLVIVMLALTGASVSYRAIAKELFGVENMVKASQQYELSLENNWHAWLTAANAKMPDAELMQIRFPRQKKKPDKVLNNMAAGATPPSGSVKVEGINRINDAQFANIQVMDKTPKLFEFRYLTKDDWLGLAKSKVFIDKKTSTLTRVTPFKSLSMGEKMYSLLIPLHTGRNLHASYVLVLLVFSLIGTIMVFSGLVSFIIKKRQWSRNRNISTEKELLNI